MCGATDCRKCSPGNFYRGVYVGDYEDDEKGGVEEAVDAALEEAAMDEVLARELDKTYEPLVDA
jgi:hypothetical protein